MTALCALLLAMPPASTARAAVVAYYDFAPSTVSVNGGTTTIANLGTAGSALNGYWFSAADAPTTLAGMTGSSGVAGNILALAPSSTSSPNSYMEIDGLNTYMPALNYTGTAAWSYSVLVNTPSLGGTFFSQGNNTGFSGSWSYASGDSFFYMDSNGNGGTGSHRIGEIRSGGGNYGSTVSLPATPVWDMVTIVYNGNGGANGAAPSIYLNGSANQYLSETQTLSQSASGNVVRVGWAGSIGAGGALDFTGSMANVAFWNQALSQGEAASLYNLTNSTLSAINQYNDLQMSSLFAIAKGTSASTTLASNGTTINWAPSTSGTAALVSSGGTLGQEWASGGNYYAWLESSTSSGTYFAVQGTVSTNFVWSGTSGNSWETAANWSLSSGTSSSTIPDGVGFTATFGSSGSTSPAVLGVGHTVSGLAFLGSVSTTISGSGALTLSSSGGGVPIAVAGVNTISAPLIFSSNTTVSLASAGQLTISGPISGNGSLTAAGSGGGSGLLVLSGSNSYTGGANVSGGTLQLGSPTALGASSNTLSISGGALDLAGQLATAGSVTLAGGSIIDSGGTGSLTASSFNAQSGSIAAALAGAATPFNKTTAGLVALSGNNTFGGGVAVSGGTLQLGSAMALGAGSNSLSVGGATLDLAGQLATAGSVTLASGSIVDSAGNGSLTGMSFTLQSGSVSANLAGAAASLTKTTTATVTLSGSNSFSGPTSIISGTLVLANSSALSATSGIAFGGGTLQYTSSNTADYSAIIASSSAAISVNTNGSAVVFNTHLGASNTGGLTKLGAGMLTLAGLNAYTGLTTVSAGTLAVNGSLSYVDSISVAGGASLSLLSAGSAGTTTLLSGGTLDGSPLGINTYTLAGLGFSGNAALSTPALTGPGAFLNVGALSASGTANSVVINVPATTLSAGTYGIISYGGGSIGGGGLGDFKLGSISVTGGNAAQLIDTGSALDILVSSNKIWNGTAVDWVDAGAWTFNSAPETFQNGDFNIFDDTAGTKNTNVALNTSNVAPGGVTFNNNALAYSVSGSFGITGLAALSVNGSGSVTISTSNNYSGGTFLNSGLLNINNAAAIGTGTLSVAGGTIGNSSGAAIALSTNNPQTWVSGSIYFSGPSNLDLGAGAVTMGTNSVVTVSAGTLALDGAIGDGGAGYNLTKTGSGGLVLSGTNTYSGNTTANAGLLILAGSNKYANTTINGGGTLQVGNSGASGTLGSGSVADNGVLVFARSDGAAAVANVVSGSGSVIMAGPGRVTMSGSNSYTGGTIVSGGTLQLGNTAGLGANTGAATVASGGLLDLHGFSPTLGALNGNGVIDNFAAGGTPALTVGNGGASGSFSGTIQSTAGALSIVKTGSGTLYLSGTNTYSGGTQINGGTLNIASPLAVQNSTVNVSASNSLVFGVPAATLGGLSGSGSINLGATALTVGANNANSAYAGSLSGGSGLTKTGSGTLTLTAANSYSGATRISGGVLQLSSNTPLTSLPSNASLLYNLDTSGSGNYVLNGSNVTQVNDLSGNGNNFSNPNSIVTLVNGGGAFNGNNLLNFSGSAAATLTMTNASSPRTVFIIEQVTGVVPNSGVGNNGMFGDANVDEDIRVQTGPVIANVGGSANVGDFTFGGGSMYINGVLQSGNATAGSPQLLEATSGSEGAGPFPWNSTALSNTQTSYPNNRFFRGEIGQVLAYSTSLSQADRQAVESYLLYKWFGIVSATGNPSSGDLPSTTPLTISNGGALDMSNGTQTIASLSSTDGLGSRVLLGSFGILTIGDSTSSTFDGVISGAGGVVVKQGSGMLLFSGANVYSGGTIVRGGTLQLGNASALGMGGLTANSGVVDLNGQQPAFAASLSGTAGVVTNSNFSTVAELDLLGGAATTFSGTLRDGAGQIGLQIDGGTLTLAGTNITHSGPTTINGGSLIAAAANVLSPSSAVTVSGGLLDVTAGSQSIAGLTMGSGSLNLTIGTLLNVAAPASLNGTLTLSGTYSGSFIDLLSSTSLSGSFAASNVSANYPGYTLEYTMTQVDLVHLSMPTWSFSAGGNWSASSNWSPSVPDHQGALAILGSNLLTSDTVTLDTPQTVGTLVFANSAAAYTLSGSNTLTLDNTGGTAAGSQVMVVAGTHAINAPLFLSNGSLTVSASNSSFLTMGGNISDDNAAESLTLMGDGSGQLVLSGSNTYGGGTFVNQGTLIVNSPGALLDGSGLTVGQDASSIFAPAIAGPSLAVPPGVAAVPEPGTLALLLAALCSAIIHRRIRRKYVPSAGRDYCAPVRRAT